MTSSQFIPRGVGLLEQSSQRCSTADNLARDAETVPDIRDSRSGSSAMPVSYMYSTVHAYMCMVSNWPIPSWISVHQDLVTCLTSSSGAVNHECHYIHTVNYNHDTVSHCNVVCLSQCYYYLTVHTTHELIPIQLTCICSDRYHMRQYSS